MVTIALLVFGLVAATRLPVNLLPDISYPSITVQTTYQDAAPVEVETLITRPIEELVGAVPGLVGVESVSRESVSEVVLNFAWGTSVDRAMSDIREKLDRVNLPTQAERPIVLRYDPSQEAIMRIAVRPAPDSPIAFATLRLEVERAVKLDLEKIPGVAAAVLYGGERDEIRVELDPQRLSAFALRPQDIVTAIDGDNVNRPGGAIDFRDRRHLIRTVHEARTPEDLGQVVVRNEGGRVLRVRDIGEVSRRPIEREELSLVDGQEVIELAIYREGDANTVSVARRIRERLETMRLSRGSTIEVLNDRAVFIESAVDEVISNVLLGGVLAVFVLLLFLRDLWSTLVIAIAIPVSVLVSFVPLQVAGVSLNLMSLGGLALGVGMLVDNSIVTLEAISRMRTSKPNLSRREAAARGTTEVGTAVVASTLTTVAVFVPLVFVVGVAGQLVRDLALAVSFSIISSMLVSLSLVPVLLSFGDHEQGAHSKISRRRLIVPLLACIAIPAAYLSLEGTPRIATITTLMLLALPALGMTLSWLLSLSRRLLKRTEKPRDPEAADSSSGLYRRLLERVVRHPAVYVSLAAGLTALSILGATGLGRTLIPSIEQQQFFVQLSMPQGSSLERTTEVTRTLMRAVSAHPQTQLVFGRVGSLTQAGAAAGSQRGTHLAQIDVTVDTKSGPRPMDVVEDEVFTALNAKLGDRGILRLDHPSLINFAAPLEIRTFSDDLSSAKKATQRVLPELRKIAQLRDVTPDDLSGRPEVVVDFDRVKLGLIQLSIDDAASVTQAFVQGQVAATKLHTDEEQLDIRVQLPQVNRTDEEDVRAIQVGAIDGIPVRLSSVAKVEARTGPAEIRRIEGQRGIRIHARLTSVDLAAARNEVAKVLREATLDDGVAFEISGQAKNLDDSLQSMMFAALLAIFLVYVVMASTFESLHHPLLIMCTVPLAVVGVVAALGLTGLTISAMVGIGVIILGGIVVNNAIVLVAAINLRRGQGMDLSDAIIDGASTRVRPILMTTVTTVLGLTPMALGLGDGAALRQPLAVSVIGGLLTSTVLTLFVLPAVYRLFPGKTQPAWAGPSTNDPAGGTDPTGSNDAPGGADADHQ